ncbi:coiled-coil domain-containing protein 9-like isoform X9 [Stegostoma tigrinum]|uniref:coiled-coil domain-containing protein 9-like isoform X9 n=1 Tax=Stegostoma tigrinum TaxID=3053191 RepID=UPI0028701078|nr:coiled-coil domain-containing protein 9-like isoform X9 [Stegostoma tigrinum]
MLFGSSPGLLIFKMHKTDTAVDVILKTKEEKDVELDRKIEALRKKNEALMKRYQEIEEDKKKAEMEGMAVTTRKNRPENLTITITKAPNEKRVVSEKRMFGGSSILRGCESDAGQRFSVGRGQRLRKFVVEESKAKEWEERRKQNIEKMNEEMEKIAEYERSQMEGGLPTQKGTVDMTLLMTGRERAEYVRWKKEREQIDQERLARHKNSKGEWKRAWDANKTEDMFREDFTVENELVFHKRKGHCLKLCSGRNTRKCSGRFQHHDARDDGNHSDKTKELFPWSEATDNSKSKGKNRLTGRARNFKLDIKEKNEIQRDTGGQKVETVTEEHTKQKVNEDEELRKNADLDVVMFDWQEVEEGTDDCMNGEWETIETRDSQTSSVNCKADPGAPVDAEGTVNKPKPCSSKLGNLSLVEELMRIRPILHHNVPGKNNSDFLSESGISGHAVLTGNDMQDLEETGNVLNYCSSSDSSKKSVSVASDAIADQLRTSEDHLPLKDRNPLGLELSGCPNSLDGNAVVLEKSTLIAVCDEENKCSSAAGITAKGLAVSVKLQDQTAEEFAGKLQPALIADCAETLQDHQDTSFPTSSVGIVSSVYHPEKYQEELSKGNLRTDTDCKEIKGTPDVSAVALKPSSKVSPDAAILDITSTIIGMMIEEK